MHGYDCLSILREPVLKRRRRNSKYLINFSKPTQLIDLDKLFIFFRFVKKKFEESYFQSTAPDRVDRVFKIYRTTALDQKVVKKTFKLVDETLRRRNLFEAGLLWASSENCMLKKNNNILTLKRWSDFGYTRGSGILHIKSICWFLFQVNLAEWVMDGKEKKGLSCGWSPHPSSKGKFVAQKFQDLIPWFVIMFL